jgi:hypothetical protein
LYGIKDKKLEISAFFRCVESRWGVKKRALSTGAPCSA